MVATIAAFFALSYAATFVDRQGIAAKLKAANARGELTQTWAGWSGRAIPRFHGNDCLMLAALLQDERLLAASGFQILSQAVPGTTSSSTLPATLTTV